MSTWPNRDYIDEELEKITSMINELEEELANEWDVDTREDLIYEIVRLENRADELNAR